MTSWPSFVRQMVSGYSQDVKNVFFLLANMFYARHVLQKNVGILVSSEKKAAVVVLLIKHKSTTKTWVLIVHFVVALGLHMIANFVPLGRCSCGVLLMPLKVRGAFWKGWSMLLACSPTRTWPSVCLAPCSEPPMACPGLWFDRFVEHDAPIQHFSFFAVQLKTCFARIANMLRINCVYKAIKDLLCRQTALFVQLIQPIHCSLLLILFEDLVFYAFSLDPASRKSF